MQLEQRVVACGGVPRRWTAAAGCSVVQQQGLIEVCVLLLIQLVEKRWGAMLGPIPCFVLVPGRANVYFPTFFASIQHYDCHKTFACFHAHPVYLHSGISPRACHCGTLTIHEACHSRSSSRPACLPPLPTG